MSAASPETAAPALNECCSACLNLLENQVPLSLLVDLALPTTPAEYEDVRDEHGDTSWVPPVEG